MNINALYESATNSIIKEMETGAVPWIKPWKTPRNHGSVMPHNVALAELTAALTSPSCGEPPTPTAIPRMSG